MAQGIYPIYKEKGPTSHDVIDKIRQITGERTVGHAGTLDPLASGVLVVGVGREYTKKLGEIVQGEKEYLAKIKLGEESTTDDEEGEKTARDIPTIPASGDIEVAIKEFVGTISQVPPVYSAVKVGGKESYKRARKSEIVELSPRPVRIYSIEVLNYEWPFLTIRAVTGQGVYIRALARDIGNRLGTGGYLAELERTRVGQYTKEDALTVTNFKNRYSHE